MMTLGDRIHQLRTERGLTHTELGEMLAPRPDGSRPSGRSYLYQIESGQSSPTLRWLEKAAGAFDLSVLELLAPIYGQDIEGAWADVTDARHDLEQSALRLDRAVQDVMAKDFARRLERER